jgi:TolB-like protein
MMARRLAALAAALLLPALARGAPPGGPKRTKVAVMEIRALGTEPHKAELLSEVALTEASGVDRIDVIGRSDIASMVGFEKQRQVMGCAEDSGCLAEIGGALGVDYILVGSLGRLGGLYRVDLKLVDTRKARVVARFGESVEGQEEKLVTTVQRGVRQLLLPILGGDLPLPPGAKPRPNANATTTAARTSTGSPVGTPPPTSTAASPGPGWTRGTWGWTAAGAGAVAVGVGAVFGLAARRALDDEKKASAAGDLATYRSSKDKARSSALLADVGFGVGALGLGVGTWLILTDRPASVALLPTDGGALAVYTGRF